MEEIFSPILDDDEKVIKVIKPNKFMQYARVMLSTLLWYIFIGIFVVIGALAGVEEEGVETGGVAVDTQIVELAIIISLAIVVGLLVITLLIEWLFTHLYYKNVYYGYTNKRIVIRKGIFGVDYKSLDIKMIGASTVNVSLLDKIFRKNTGTINFGSMASPINGMNGINNYILANVTDPYGLYKEIKSYISSANQVAEATTSVKEVEVAPASTKEAKPRSTRKATTTKSKATKKETKEEK